MEEKKIDVDKIPDAPLGSEATSHHTEDTKHTEQKPDQKMVFENLYQALKETKEQTPPLPKEIKTGQPTTIDLIYQAINNNNVAALGKQLTELNKQLTTQHNNDFLKKQLEQVSNKEQTVAELIKKLNNHEDVFSETIQSGTLSLDRLNTINLSQVRSLKQSDKISKLKEFLTYAVQQSKTESVSYLLNQIKKNKASLNKSDLDNLLATCIRGNPKKNSETENTLKTLFLAFPSTDNSDHYIDECIHAFVESPPHDNINKNKYLFWLLKVKFGIPLAVNTGGELPLTWVMQNFAETVNVQAVNKNAEVIRLLAQSAADNLLINAEQINTAIELALALDNSENLTIPGGQNKNTNKNTAFTQIFSGISAKNQVNNIVEALLQGLKTKKTQDPLLESICIMLQRELESEINGTTLSHRIF